MAASGESIEIELESDEATPPRRITIFSRVQDRYEGLRPHVQRVKRGWSCLCWILSAVSLLASLVALISVLTSSSDRNDLVSLEYILDLNYTLKFCTGDDRSEMTFALNTDLNEVDLRNMYTDFKQSTCMWVGGSVSKHNSLMLMFVSAVRKFDITSRMTPTSAFLSSGQIWLIPDISGRFKVGVTLQPMPTFFKRYVMLGYVTSGLENLDQMTVSNTSTCYIHSCI